MLTIHQEGSYKFRFYSRENNEPPHIHVWSPIGQMKVWLNAELDIAECYGIPNHEQKKLLDIVTINCDKWLAVWKEKEKITKLTMEIFRQIPQEKIKKRAVYQKHSHPQFLSLIIELEKLTAQLD